jgi:hypothetical protein
MAMSPDANVSLLQRIVEDQRKIIAEVTGKDPTEIPQVWALYKEVQEYYDKGMRVPDDVTLLLCDDNWGNIRKLPDLNDPPRSGGYGIYYHYDFVGGPRNYKWLNTSQIERVWEQMHLAYEYGADRIWVVNVGDIKPMEFPISFFLDYAWNPEIIKAEDLPEYYNDWAEKQFGPQYKDEIAMILSKYTKYNSRRKPEMLSPETYSLVNYREYETVVSDYNDLHEKAKDLYNKFPSEYKDAFYQLVLHPVEACSNLNELYYTTAKNRMYSRQGRNLTNKLADRVEELYNRDASITYYYNNILADGKWKHMMDQTHIGYTYWQQPEEQTMPVVEVIDIPDDAEMGVAVEGFERAYLNATDDAALPEFDVFNKQTYYTEVFNLGSTPFEYSVIAKDPWIVIEPASGKIENEERIFVSIDWNKAPTGNSSSSFKFESSYNEEVTVNVKIKNPDSALRDAEDSFVENNGCISFEAVNYSDKTEIEGSVWTIIPNLGRTSSAITIMPATTKDLSVTGISAALEYNLYFMTDGVIDIHFYLSPTQNFGYDEGLQFAYSLDKTTPVIINMHKGDTPDWKYPAYWNKAVGNNIRIKSVKNKLNSGGRHTLEFYAIDAGIVLQKIVIDAGGLKQSYLGPPESTKIE